MASSAATETDFPALGSVMVTGGCGFLGTHIVTQLLQRSSPDTTKISVLDVREPRISLAGVSYFTADITSVVSLQVVLDLVKPDVVIHSVSPVFESGGGNKAREKMKLVNVDGTRILMEQCKKIGTKVFVYTSSSSVISDGRTDIVNADERYSLLMGKHQPEYYSGTKAEAEELVLSHNTRSPAATPFLTVSIRPALMFGEHDVQAIPPMLDVVRRGQTRYQFGSNDNLYDFTYAGNVAHAHILAAIRLSRLAARLAAGTAPPDEEPVDGESFIITNGSPIYFWDFPRAIWQAYYRRATVNPPPPPPAEIKSTVALSFGFAYGLATFLAWVTWLLWLPPPRLKAPNVRFSVMTRYFRPKKAQARLGYRPVWSVEEGIERTVEWFCQKEAEEAGKKDR